MTEWARELAERLVVGRKRDGRGICDPLAQRHRLPNTNKRTAPTRRSIQHHSIHCLTVHWNGATPSFRQAGSFQGQGVHAKNESKRQMAPALLSYFAGAAGWGRNCV